MNDSDPDGVVLRQWRLERNVAHLTRRRATVAPAPDPLESARLAAQNEGFRLGHAEGLRSGHEEGLLQAEATAHEAAVATARETQAQAARERVALAAEVSALLTNIRSRAEDWQARAEEELVSLCYETICRVLGHALLTPEGLRAQVQELLRQRAGALDMELHLHPRCAALLAAADLGSALRWVPDPRVEPGGCVLHGGGAGALDCRLQTILEEVRDALLATWSGNP